MVHGKVSNAACVRKRRENPPLWFAEEYFLCSAVALTFLQPEEILKLSVKRVTQPQIYDNLNQPIAGGLYDTALGPIEKHESCITCGLNSKDCQGHMGHIQLSLPVYHPLLFDILYKLIKAKCFVCHKFRCNRLKVRAIFSALTILPDTMQCAT
jgi:DNA-directed RNA polymerase I subunit RPA1